MSNLKLPNVIDYATAERELGNKEIKRIGYKTALVRKTTGEIVVTHHNSEIISYDHDGSTYITNAGWDSATTKDRLHRLTPINVRVFQKNWIQYVQIDNNEPVQLRGWVRVA